MELQAVGEAPEAERLVLVAVTGSQVHRAVGDGEGVTVPVDDRHTTPLGTEHSIGSTLGGELDLSHTDLGCRPRRHRRSQGGRQQLRSQAHPEHRHVRRDRLGDPHALGVEPRELLGVVHAHGAPHDDGTTDPRRRREGVADVESHHVEVDAGGVEDVGEKAGAFVRRVLRHDPGEPRARRCRGVTVRWHGGVRGWRRP